MVRRTFLRSAALLALLVAGATGSRPTAPPHGGVARLASAVRAMRAPARARPVAVFKFLEEAFAPKVGPDETQESSRLVPDVIGSRFDESVPLEVRYPAWVRSSMNMKDIRSFGDTPTEGAGLLRQVGIKVTPTQVRDAPKVYWEPAAAGAADNDPLAAAPDEQLKYYALALVDADAPSPAEPSSRSWVHWLVVNIPGNELVSGTTLRPYVGAFPPANTGAHRYFFLLMEQRSGEQRFARGAAAPGGVDGLSVQDMETRAGWSCDTFVAEHGLRVVGWHHFVAEFDPYCLELLQEFKNLR